VETTSGWNDESEDGQETEAQRFNRFCRIAE
jgi:hypothetical protein